VPEPFTFGIPLIARSAACDWRRVEALLGLTLASLRAQTDPDFCIVIAGHDRPSGLPADPRLRFLPASWPAGPVRADNLDSGRKKHAICDFVLARGGGLLMFVDADDWVDTRMIAAARATITPDHVGGFIENGFATDIRGLRAAALPDPRIFPGGFQRLCGSSTVARLVPGCRDPLRRNPHVLHEHFRWPEAACEHGARVVRLQVCGSYVINTAENHSELHGPFAAWRREFGARVGCEGRALDADFAARFGLDLERIHAAARHLTPRASRHAAARAR
jgi:hypothetical protein